MTTITNHPLSAMLADLFGYGSRQKRPTSRTKLFAVMPDGTERRIYRTPNCGWNHPSDHCYSSHLDCAKQAWVDAGTVKFIRK